MVEQAVEKLTYCDPVPADVHLIGWLNFPLLVVGMGDKIPDNSIDIVLPCQGGHNNRIPTKSQHLVTQFINKIHKCAGGMRIVGPECRDHGDEIAEGWGRRALLEEGG